MGPDTDSHPPILHSDEYEEPIPVPGLVNTAGAEDSPFSLPDGRTLYFFFAPDPAIPVEKQVHDQTVGIYVSHLQADGSWGEPEKLALQSPGKLSLDGCQFVQDDRIWVCSAREGYTGIHWFTGTLDGAVARDITLVPEPLNEEYEVGELHYSKDLSTLHFHSTRDGGKGGYDLWVTEKEGGKWASPRNLETLNTELNEGWPYLSQDGSELWFLRTVNGTPAIFRSVRDAGCHDAADCWTDPELIVSQFAGEPSLDDAGNLYFVHHYYRDGQMIEADIYVAMRK